MTIEHVVNEMVYRSYTHQRRLAPDVPAAEWAALFTEAEAFEVRYQAERQCCGWEYPNRRPDGTLGLCPAPGTTPVRARSDGEERTRCLSHAQRDVLGGQWAFVELEDDDDDEAYRFACAVDAEVDALRGK